MSMLIFVDLFSHPNSFVRSGTGDFLATKLGRAVPLGHGVGRERKNRRESQKYLNLCGYLCGYLCVCVCVCVCKIIVRMHDLALFI